MGGVPRTRGHDPVEGDLEILLIVSVDTLPFLGPLPVDERGYHLLKSGMMCKSLRKFSSNGGKFEVNSYF